MPTQRSRANGTVRKGADDDQRFAGLMRAAQDGDAGAFGLRLFHSPELSLMVLAWQFGTVMLLALAAGACGRRVIYWRHLAPAHA